ncbi:MAG TPA: glycerophosphodiester phosphodiesterase family protein, partial [Anaeromyxobacteraceae bacterium]|nr:glycerophosphodiester phosphodiesterase family protein [Anaeromyxobacteraceae bacterium]
MSAPSYPSVPGRPLVLGHRGASADAPENTRAAFHAALEQGADGFELDVWRCGSGEAVVIHDPDARRTGQSPVAVAGSSLGRLRELDVGRWRGDAFAGERIPTLDEVLTAFPKAIVNVELKSARVPDLGLPVEVVRTLRQQGAESRVVVSSFSAALLAAFRSLAPDVATGFLVAPGAIAWARAEAAVRAIRPTAIHLARELATGKRLSAWGA